MKISTPPLLKMRSVVSDDGRWARFFLLFKTGQNAAFSLPFNTIGLYLKAIKNVIRTMADRIAARGAFSSAEIADGLVEAVTVKAVASGRDAETGDRLLWVETIDSGVFTFRLDHETTEMFTDAIRDDEDAPGVQVGSRPIGNLAQNEEPKSSRPCGASGKDWR